MSYTLLWPFLRLVVLPVQGGALGGRKNDKSDSLRIVSRGSAGRRITTLYARRHLCSSVAAAVSPPSTCFLNVSIDHDLSNWYMSRGSDLNSPGRSIKELVPGECISLTPVVQPFANPPFYVPLHLSHRHQHYESPLSLPIATQHIVSRDRACTPG